jgi:hypothetical protein
VREGERVERGRRETGDAAQPVEGALQRAALADALDDRPDESRRDDDARDADAREPEQQRLRAQQPECAERIRVAQRERLAALGRQRLRQYRRSRSRSSPT